VSDTPTFTVFTPTYNRAHTLHRVYDSLCAQTLRDFEWLVVDDGSTDNTAELIADWAKVADFPIRYLKREHLGKHVAHNLAVREARGQFVAPLDSDDALPPASLERIHALWSAIPVSDREAFSGIGGLCCDQHRKIIGDSFPRSPLDTSLRELIFGLRIRGEKWGVTLTDVLRQYPFPELSETQFVPEGLVGLQMSRTYKRRYVNEVFRIYYRFENQAPGKNLTNRPDVATNAPGRLCYYLWLLNNELEFFWRSPIPFAKAAVVLPILARFSNRSFRELLQSLEKPVARFLVLMALPFALVVYTSNRVSTLLNHTKRNFCENIWQGPSRGRGTRNRLPQG
jgi:glycosyltransferase involved in cell wall biosynthesis